MRHPVAVSMQDLEGSMFLQEDTTGCTRVRTTRCHITWMAKPKLFVSFQTQCYTADCPVVATSMVHRLSDICKVQHVRDLSGRKPHVYVGLQL